MKKEEKAIINFRVEKELKELFEKRAAEKNLTLTAYIIQRCLGHLKQVQNDFKEPYKKPNGKWIAAGYSKKWRKTK